MIAFSSIIRLVLLNLMCVACYFDGLRLNLSGISKNCLVFFDLIHHSLFCFGHLQGTAPMLRTRSGATT